MKIRWLACGMLIAFGLGCSEPNSSVTRSTEDDQFEVTLKAAKNHLKPGEALPILVTVESLAGQLAQTTAGTITFVTNQGSVSPSRLDFTLLGRDDSLSTGVTTTYTQWVTFTLGSRPDEGRQAEVHALFRDLDTTLKIRIVEE
ncbi:MAG: hypothetical protein HOM68_22435 [Gemmatimonadetes bacterium]|jgi:hypothetical protein|nr:hypothetical protein [Gemmatimonadota bacterium]MBT4609145.1 hypothetical protein [Gemmatimonadota bacterium]MBT5059318.1 hypothetical protein [Gemmatimonadota bacterium]MBT5145568.1 hypothetical protein [Gemmatimonadota bacterium]MBT5591756.1 hypothetical protein [Gemmatimonadota bacterium]